MPHFNPEARSPDKTYYMVSIGTSLNFHHAFPSSRPPQYFFICGTVDLHRQMLFYIYVN